MPTTRRAVLVGGCSALLLAARGEQPLHRARHRAARYLQAAREADGAWRSRSYGAFRDGTGLTALAHLALRESGEDTGPSGTWLQENWEQCLTRFPVHNASWLLRAGSPPGQHAEIIDRLRSLQLGDALGWQPEDAAYGGWGYAPRAPRRAGEIAPFQQPNLSATALALDGLRAAGIPTDDPAVVAAMHFVRSCQNARPGEEPTPFDDSGFFQMPADPTRNKAGLAGRDASGAIRQRSYTSATADGLRALRHGGRDSQRAALATAWLAAHADIDDVPDLRHYAAASLRRSRGQPITTLLTTQRPDGSWHNPAGEMREDEPIVATSLALLALGVACR